MGGRHHHPAVEVVRADEVVEHLGPDHPGVEHRRSLAGHPLEVRGGHLRCGQAHVAPKPEPQLGRRLLALVGDHPRERTADQLGDLGVEIGAVQAADVVGLEDVRVRDYSHDA